jgi:hypothetical protein
MNYTIAKDGDGFEQMAWRLFLRAEFPSYEVFWQRHIVPLTNRPTDIQLKDDASLKAAGKNDEDVAIAQLHYTVLKHLFRAHQVRSSASLDDFALFVGLSALVGAHDVAFEVLQRHTHRGQYDPWLESRLKGRKTPRNSGQDAQSDWKSANRYPLQQIRDYRNKLVHGRTPPATGTVGKMLLPALGMVDKYCDWRSVTAPGAMTRIPAGDFEPISVILETAWRETVDYLEHSWRQTLV